MFDRLDDILIRFEELLHELGDPVLTSDPEKFRRLMKEQAELAPLVETYTQYKKTKKSIEENLELLEEERDEEMRELLKEDLAEAKKQMPELEKELKLFFFQKILMMRKTYLLRFVLVQAEMRQHFLPQICFVCTADLQRETAGKVS